MFLDVAIAPFLKMMNHTHNMLFYNSSPSYFYLSLYSVLALCVCFYCIFPSAVGLTFPYCFDDGFYHIQVVFLVCHCSIHPLSDQQPVYLHIHFLFVFFLLLLLIIYYYYTGNL